MRASKVVKWDLTLLTVVAEHCTIAPAVARKIMDYYLLAKDKEIQLQKEQERDNKQPLFW